MEITLHKYSGLMAAGYVMITPLVTYNLAQVGSYLVVDPVVTVMGISRAVGF